MSAQLATLADAIVTALHSAPSGTWSDYTVGIGEDDFVKAIPSLDPVTVFESTKKALFVSPVTMTYNRGASQGRQKIITLQRSPVIALCLWYRFTTPDSTGVDVASWVDVKKVLNLREEIDLFVLKKDWGWNIGDITAEPAQEIPLKARGFLSVTEIEFDGMTC